MTRIWQYFTATLGFLVLNKIEKQAQVWPVLKYEKCANQ